MNSSIRPAIESNSFDSIFISFDEQQLNSDDDELLPRPQPRLTANITASAAIKDYI
ncbi:hypothetical protein HanPI659440_Chr17g0661901 [Helianthus annuus]|nr:hypothetical protein HanPI659440_Chr17g0661901 [Helianthus annuus]